MSFAIIFEKMFTDNERAALLSDIKNFQNRYGSDCKNQYLTLRALKKASGKTIEVFINHSGVICLFDIY